MIKNSAKVVNGEEVKCFNEHRNILGLAPLLADP